MKKLIYLAIVSLLILSGCSSKAKPSDKSEITQNQIEMFTTNMAASFDGKYYAIIGVKMENDETLAVVNVFSETGDSIYSFTSGNVDNFFGVCWEKDTYNIWTLSLDKGMTCHEYDNEEWTLNESAALPDYMK